MRNVTKQEGVLINKVAAAKEPFVDEDESGSYPEHSGRPEKNDLSPLSKKAQNGQGDLDQIKDKSQTPQPDLEGEKQDVELDTASK